MQGSVRRAATLLHGRRTGLPTLESAAYVAKPGDSSLHGWRHSRRWPWRSAAFRIRPRSTADTAATLRPAMAASHSCRKRRVWPLILLGAIGAQTTFVPPAKSDSSTRTLAAPRGNSPAAALAMTPLLLSTPASAQEEAGFASAFVAYGHYLGLVLSAACLVTERLTVKAGMTREEEQRLQVTDAVYGLAAVLIVVTGYLRVTQYGKGWEFYQHEPIFWVKLSLIAVTGAVSFFVTTTVVKRAIAQNEAGDKDIAPVSEKLANRMTSVINAQLLAIGSIPLAATLMARGAFYADWLPWQAGAFPAALLLVGLGFRYVKEALDWTDDEPAAA